MSQPRFEKLVKDLKDFCSQNTSNSALVAWVSSQFDLRKNPNGMTPQEVLIEIAKIRK